MQLWVTWISSRLTASPDAVSVRPRENDVDDDDDDNNNDGLILSINMEYGFPDEAPASEAVWLS